MTTADRVRRMEDSLRSVVQLAEEASRTVEVDGKEYPCNGDNLGRIEVAAK